MCLLPSQLLVLCCWNMHGHTNGGTVTCIKVCWKRPPAHSKKCTKTDWQAQEKSKIRTFVASPFSKELSKNGSFAEAKRTKIQTHWKQIKNAHNPEVLLLKTCTKLTCCTLTDDCLCRTATRGFRSVGLFMFVCFCLFLFILFAAPFALPLFNVGYQLTFIIIASSSTGSPMLKNEKRLKTHVMTTTIDSMYLNPIDQTIVLPTTKIVCDKNMYTTNQKYDCFGLRGFH